MDAPSCRRGWMPALERSGRVDPREAVGSDVPEAGAAATGCDDLPAATGARPRPARGRFTILDLAPISRLRANDCRFMRGRFFCGAPTQPGASWCEAHAAVVFDANTGGIDLPARAAAGARR